ncbi:MAG: N-acetylmuramic acid 6-phosphate etherase [Parafilimonas sp.]
MLTTEQPSHYRHLEKMPVKEIIAHINEEDKTIAIAVEKALPQIEKLIIALTDKMLAGGRLFYIGAGTSGRLGILDASECPPTYGVDYNLVQGIIAGGFNAIIRAAEFAEDDTEQGWIDLESKNISDKDFVIGIAASGTTPYVIGALHYCKKNNLETGCITCNANTPLAAAARFPIEILTGAEFVTGSTRMKAGTAQKMALNIISTTVMIQLGRVEDNSMVNMQLSNEKLIDRGVKMLMQQSQLTDYSKSKEILLQYGSVKKAAASVQKT